ncbi:MAG: hypothetical protein EOO59_01030 [Hymenobacter sp.]|nr:MAG: hypothetical protein EOO59_01030 [Hymenobacter sp.]
MKKIYLLLLLALQTSAGYVLAQSVGINASGALPDPKAMLDVASTTSGLLIPRMTTAQRNAISTPTVGLQVFNLTTNTLDIYRGTTWESVGYSNPGNSVINVNSLSDLPAPVNGAITLVAGKIYSFSGTINIGANYINTNGAALRGNNPLADGVFSTVSGAVLRSTNAYVFLQNLVVVLGSAATAGYDFADATGTKTCIVVSANSVTQAPGLTSTAGVGQVSGFRTVMMLMNYFDANDGLKVTGNMGRFVCGYNMISSITPGKAGIELLAGLSTEEVDIANTHFIYSGTGQIGVKLASGATVGYGRLTSNMFQSVTTPISGFSGSTPGWEMQQNTGGIVNTRAQAFLYMNDNTTATGFGNTSNYYKILGNTTLIRSQKFTAANNQITYIGKSTISVQVTAVVGGKSPQAGADYSIVLAKNGTAIPTPAASMGSMLSGQGFQIVLTSDVEVSPGDYLEIGIRNNANTNNVVISDLQFRVSE